MSLAAPLFALAAVALPSQSAPPARSQDAKPLTLLLRRKPEPAQRAFTVLVPDKWELSGGLFSVDPQQSGGALNSIETKCDFAVRKDSAGSVMCRWAPTWNYVDFSQSMEFALLAGTFAPGSHYNGALVKPMPTPEAFLEEGFKAVRPKATEVKMLERVALPELVEVLQSLSGAANSGLAAVGKPPMTFAAAGLVWEYTEGGARYREGAATAICDLRRAAGLWSNQFTFHMRAPASEADAWKPLLDIVRQSIRIDPQWLAAYQRATNERSQTAADVFRTLARIDQEIFERRSKQRSDIQHENYLLLTGQEEYVNPYTKEVERDNADYKLRWVTSAGDYLYTDADTYDPNRDPLVNQLEWKQTPVRKR